MVEQAFGRFPAQHAYISLSFRCFRPKLRKRKRRNEKAIAENLYFYLDKTKNLC